MQRTFQISTFILIIIFCFSFSPGKKWKAFGPNITPMPKQGFSGWSASGLGRIFDIETSPTNSNKIWVCSPNGGLFFTKNKGKRWKNIQLPCPGGAIHLERVKIAKNKYRLFVASNVNMAGFPAYSYGIFSTTDNGKHWDTIQLLTPIEYNLSNIGAMKWVNNRLYYSVNGVIYIYQNGVITKLHKAGFKIHSIKVNPTNKEQLYFCGEGITKYHEGKTSFNLVSSHENLKKTFKPKKCDLAFGPDGIKVIAHEQKGNYHYKLSKDNLLTNRKRLRASIDIFRTSIYFDNHRNRFLIGGIRLFSFKDSKVEQIGFPQYPKKQFMHDDVRAIAFDKDQNILVATDAGISFSDNDGKKWFNVNGCGLNITEVYDFAINETNLIAGAQDLSSFAWNNTKKKWHHMSSLYGDGGTCLAINDTWFVMRGLQLVKSENAGTKFTYMHLPMRFSSFNPKMCYLNNELYAAAKHLWKYKDNKWSNLSQSIDPNYAISSFIMKDEMIFISKKDPVWGAKDMKGKLYRSYNKGTNWVDITANFKAYAYREITDMCFSESKDIIYACLGGFDNPKGSKEKVYLSKDSGNTWQNISYNLPNVPCTKIKEVKGVGLMVGTNSGLYYLADNQKWLRYGKELPKCPITQIILHEDKLMVSTYGRGIWVMK